MDTCGIRMIQSSKEAGDSCSHSLFGFRLASCLWIGLLSFSLLTACANIGVPPRLNGLEILRPGVSTEADILQSLGEPRGRGIARFTADFEPREVWFYEHVESRGSDVSLTLLLVLVKQGLYDGHLWFSSEEEGRTKWQRL